MSIIKNTGALFSLCRTYYVVPLVGTALVGYLNGTSGSSLYLLSDALLICISMLSAGMAAWAGNEIADSKLDALGTTKSRWGLYASGGTKILSRGCCNCAASTFTGCDIVYYCHINSLSARAGLHAFDVARSTCWVCIFSSTNTTKRSWCAWPVAGIGHLWLCCYLSGWLAAGALLTIETFVVGIILTATYFGIDGIAQLLDYEQDSRNRETTLCVSYGYKPATYLFAALQVVPLILSLLVYHTQSTTFEFNSIAMPAAVVCLLCFSYFTICHRETATLATLRILGVPLCILTSISFALAKHMLDTAPHYIALIYIAAWFSLRIIAIAISSATKISLSSPLFTRAILVGCFFFVYMKYIRPISPALK